jgi:hypothetical protein
MSRKLQWFFGSLPSTPLIQVAGFFLSFLVLRTLLLWGIALGLEFAGHNPAVASQISESNEIFVQTLALLMALWINFRKEAFSRRVFIWELLGESRRSLAQPRIWLSTALEPLFWGFAVASLGVALSLFLGLLKLESGLGALWTYLLPLVSLRILMIVAWIFVLELTRLKLSRILAPQEGHDLVGSSALILFEGFLIYSALSTGSGAVEQALMGLVALWFASILSCWTVLSRSTMMGAWKRFCWLSSFTVSLVCLYGFPLSWGRVASLTSVHAGNFQLRNLSFDAPSILGQLSFVLIFTVAGVLMLRRVQSLSRSDR